MSQIERNITINDTSYAIKASIEDNGDLSVSVIDLVAKYKYELNMGAKDISELTRKQLYVEPSAFFDLLRIGIMGLDGNVKASYALEEEQLKIKLNWHIGIGNTVIAEKAMILEIKKTEQTESERMALMMRDLFDIEKAIKGATNEYALKREIGAIDARLGAIEGAQLTDHKAHDGELARLKAVESEAAKVAPIEAKVKTIEADSARIKALEDKLKALEAEVLRAPQLVPIEAMVKIIEAELGKIGTRLVALEAPKPAPTGAQ